MKEALKLALEALERISDRFDLESVAQDATKAITAIKEALAQPEQVTGLEVYLDPKDSLPKRYTTPPKREQEMIKGFMWSYLGVDGKERFEFSSFGKTKTKAQKHFNFQNNAQRLEPVKRHKLYAVSMTFTSEPQNDRT